MDIDNFNKEISSCEECCKGERKAPFYGNVDSKVLLVAQQPGKYKPKFNKEHVPFNIQYPWDDEEGWLQRKKDRASGYLLKDVLLLAGIGENDFAITNLVKCFIKITDDVIWNCYYWLDQEIRMMKNLRLIICLGAYSGDFFELEKYGEIREIFMGFYGVKVYHPAYIFRRPEFENTYRNHFRKIGETLRGL